MTALEARRLKRLAKDYADAWHDVKRMGGCDPLDFPGIEKRYKDARNRFYAEIDRLIDRVVTSVDLDVANGGRD